jgi:hypothetical protein
VTRSIRLSPESKDFAPEILDLCSKPMPLDSVTSKSVLLYTKKKGFFNSYHVVEEEACRDPDYEVKSPEI